MKIILVGVFNKNSTNVSQSYALKENGVNVIEFDYRLKDYALGSDIKRDSKLIELCKHEKPDAIIFSKCNEIHYSVIDECNKITKTILWYMDPLNNNFCNSLIEKIKRCNLVFCALTIPFLESKRIGGDKVHFLHEGYDTLSNYPIDCEKIYDVSFIGSLRNKRNDYYDKIKFNLINNSYGKDHSLSVSKTKINLNFTEGGTSDRSYKVLASQGFLLTEPWPNMEEDFKIGYDLVIFENLKELSDKIEYYLKNEEERLMIAKNGYNTVQKFSRINWAKNLVDKI